MADNINIKDSGGTVIPVATDEVSTLNGATVAAVAVQRLKTGYGSDGSHRDVDDTHPLPVTDTALGTSLASLVTASHTDLAAILAKLSADPATQTTLAAVLAKLSGDPATQTTLAAVLAKLNGSVSTKSAGTFGYAAGNAAASVDVPTGARITRVSVLAGATVAGSVTILGGATIPIAAGGAFDETISGDALATSSTSEVVVGGTVQAYYVAWAA